MLCVMHESDPRGSLLVNGMAVDEKKLAMLAGVPLKEAVAYVAELETSGVFSRDNGVIYSRRMRRDEEKAARDKEWGKAGGNPHLKGGLNGAGKRHRQGGG